jgi:hypothetical protein
MVRLLKSLLNLGKSIFMLPKKPQQPSLHWVKANKPIGKMSTEERAQFSKTLADSILENVKKNHP